MKTISFENGKNVSTRLQELLDSCKGIEATILFREGVYDFQSGIVLTEAHKNITLRGEGTVRFLGGQRLNHWEKVDGTPIAQRFDPEVRDKILVCDLTAEGIEKTGDFVSRGFGRLVIPAHSELFSDGIPMNLSQYPKREDFLLITDAVTFESDNVRDRIGVLKDGFFFNDERPKQWKASDSIWTLGYWKHDWANSTERVEILDTERGFIKNTPPYGNGGYRVGNRFRFYHILEEVNQPGDYYIDLETNKAYIYPLKEGAEISISVMEDPIFSLKGCENITIENISMETVRGDAIFMEYAKGCTINRCTLCNIGNYAVDILEGQNKSVLNSTIHDCGDGGILCYAGDRCTLTPANATFNNNHIYNVAKWSKCYQPPIHMIGVGMTAKHNLIHDCPHTGIMFWGNDMTIEDNEIYSVVLETGDAGAIYTGRDYTFRGNSVCHNFIHHLGGVGMGTMGIYNDDAVSGTTMNNNYFLEMTRAVFMGGGRKFSVKNNVFVKCDPAISFDCRGTDADVWWDAAWGKMVNETMKDRFYGVERYPHCDTTTPRNQLEKEKYDGQAVNAMESIYLEKYPEIKEIDDFYQAHEPGHTIIPGQAFIENNVFCAKPLFHYSCVSWKKEIFQDGKQIPYSKMMDCYINDPRRDIDYSGSGVRGDLHIEANYIAKPDDFVDADWGILSLKPDTGAQSFGYRDADFDSIGLQKELRRENPVKVYTCTKWNVEENTLCIGLRNTEDHPVSGQLFLFTSEDVEIESKTLEFTVEAETEKFYALKLSAFSSDSKVEVRSTLPGVRPSRF